MTSDFLWGTSTSAYQIEGGRGLDGKSDSIWDRFSDEGRLADRGDIASDHYHLWEKDLDLLHELGVNAYRFSVAWTRVLPDGGGNPNRAGIDFYRRLVEGLIEREIQPVLTLYHWDLPAALEEEGGWLNRDLVDKFGRYTELLAIEFGDVVGHWITHNEPWVSSFLGYQEGIFAPGVQGWPHGLTAAHHILMSHGRAAEAIRSVQPSASVGIALDCRPSTPADDDSAEANMWFDGYRNRWFFDPVFGRGYPSDMTSSYTEQNRLPGDLIRPGDEDLIAAPIDFMGINYYTTVSIARGAEESDPPEGVVGAPAADGFTEMGWRIDPAGLTDFLERIHREYSPSRLFVTENGASFSDAPDSEGRIHDERRTEYLRSHIDAVASARDRGVPVDGYFAWSLLDNIEWLLGFTQRFGLVWVDKSTLERTPKDSYHWYRDRIARGI